MNRQNTEILIETLLSNRDRFYMGDWFSQAPPGQPRNTTSLYSLERFDLEHGCGTAACMAGWAAFLAARAQNVPLHELVDHQSGRQYGTILQAAAWLGMDIDKAHSLFVADWANKRMSEVTADEAVARLRELLAEDEAQS
jgi:hypothetical protein